MNKTHGHTFKDQRKVYRDYLNSVKEEDYAYIVDIDGTVQVGKFIFILREQGKVKTFTVKIDKRNPIPEYYAYATGLENNNSLKKHKRIMLPLHLDENFSNDKEEHCKNIS